MPVEAASNPWTHAEDKLAATLPELAAFRTLTGSADATAAALKVFVDETVHPEDGEAFTVDELRSLASYAIVSSATSEGYRLSPLGVIGDPFDASGGLLLAIERLIFESEANAEATAETAKRASDRWFKNRIGELMSELVVYWQTNSGPRVIDFVVVDGPWHTHPEERASCGHWQGIELAIRWGLVRN
ncbi:MAG: hypothetical protein DWQ31_16605 [Planctomycetota bacterium]|nr:MAG: hypothetical protein DWQ31_16605 [Planctomycetota bacterium]